MTTNKETASSHNTHSAESIKKEHDENLAAAREYAATMRRLSTLNADDIKPRRKPRRSNGSDSSTQRSRSRSSSFGNLAHSFVDTIEAALNDLSEEATGGTEDSTPNTHREEHNVGTELQEFRNSARDGGSFSNDSVGSRQRQSHHATGTPDTITRRSRSPSSVAARGA